MQEAYTWDLRSFLTFPFVLMMVGGFLFVLLVPIIKLLRRTGHHAIWCLLSLLPGLNFIAFWIFAFKPWPTDKTSVRIGN
jgi:hypothetical protein